MNLEPIVHHSETYGEVTITACHDEEEGCPAIRVRFESGGPLAGELTMGFGSEAEVERNWSEFKDPNSIDDLISEILSAFGE